MEIKRCCVASYLFELLTAWRCHRGRPDGHHHCSLVTPVSFRLSHVFTHFHTFTHLVTPPAQAVAGGVLGVRADAHARTARTEGLLRPATPLALPP